MAIEVLGRRECRRLLEEVPVGWVAHCGDRGVHMVPVNFAVYADELVFCTTYGSTLDAVTGGALLTFGVGAFDAAARAGWSVTVTGTASLVGDPVVNPGLPQIEQWAQLPDTVAVSMALGTISGRRVAPTQAG